VAQECGSIPLDSRMISLHYINSRDYSHHGLIVSARIERPVAVGIVLRRKNEHRTQDSPPMPPATSGRLRKHRQEQVEHLVPRHRLSNKNQIAKCRSDCGQSAHDHQPDLISLSHTARVPIKSDSEDYSDIISQRLAILSTLACGTAVTFTVASARLTLGAAFLDGLADEGGPAVSARYGLNPDQHRSFQPENGLHRLVAAVQQRASHASANIRYNFVRKARVGAAQQRGEQP
jgi:hypothetical protein